MQLRNASQRRKGSASKTRLNKGSKRLGATGTLMHRRHVKISDQKKRGPATKIRLLVNALGSANLTLRERTVIDNVMEILSGERQGDLGKRTLIRIQRIARNYGIRIKI